MKTRALLALIIGLWAALVYSNTIPPGGIIAPNGGWDFQQLPVVKRNLGFSNQLAVLEVLFEPPSSSALVTPFANVNSRPSLTSMVAATQTDRSTTNNQLAWYLAVPVPSIAANATIWFGINNAGPSHVTYASGSQYYAAAQTNLAVDSQSTDVVTTIIAANTAGIFGLDSTDTPSALYFQLSASTVIPGSRPLVRRNAIPNFIVSSDWDTLRRATDGTTKWEGWLTTGFKANSSYYVSLFNSLTSDIPVVVTSYTTNRYDTQQGPAVGVELNPERYTIFTFNTVSSVHASVLKVSVTYTGGSARPLVAVGLDGNCPTDIATVEWSSTASISNGVEFVLNDVTPGFPYCVGIKSQPDSATTVSVSITQPGAASVGGDGDGLEDIEVAGIFMGILLAVLLLCFVIMCAAIIYAEGRGVATEYAGEAGSGGDYTLHVDNNL